MRIISAKYCAFHSKTSLRKYGEMHSISRIVDCIWTTFRSGEFLPTEDSVNIEEFCEILRKFKLFISFSQGFHNFFLGVLLQNTHIFPAFRTFSQFSQSCDRTIPCAAQALLFQQLRQSFRFLSIWLVLMASLAWHSSISNPKFPTHCLWCSFMASETSFSGKH